LKKAYNNTKAFVFLVFLTLNLSLAVAQSSKTYPSKALFWTNVQKPACLDSLQDLRLLRYKARKVVYNKAFYRTISELDSTYTFKTSLDFYEYMLKWTRKGKKQFVSKKKETKYYYFGNAAAIHVGEVRLK
jgi:hypothetical protein